VSTVAFLGLGNMGGPMSANLVTAGHSVVGYDPVAAARDAAVAAGVTLADSAVDAVAGADVVITMLPAGSFVLDCYPAVLPASRPDALFIDSSTIAVADATAAHQLAGAAGRRSLDAPVSGGVVGAIAGTLSFMVGGEAADFAAAEPFLQVMGRRITHCGGPGAGQAAKVCNNMILGVSMIAVSEAFVLGRALGLTDQALFDVASGASGQCWALTTNCPVPGPVPASPANRDYQPGFASALMLKDLRLAVAAAAATGVDAQLGRAAAQQYGRYVESGGGGRDFSAIITAIREHALGAGTAS
jgi:3-hydroxyisobutyrate dehydrogenase